MGVGDARLQLLVGDRHAQSLQSAQRVAVHHEDALQAGASVVDRIETVIAFAVIGDGELHAGVVDDALRLCRGIGVVDRHVHRADRGEREIQHAPLEAGGGEQRHRVSLADAERDEPFAAASTRRWNSPVVMLDHAPGPVLRAAWWSHWPVRAMRSVSSEYSVSSSFTVTSPGRCIR